MSHVVEIVSFETKPEFSIQEVTQRANAMEKELKKEIPGYINRRLVHKGEHGWIDIVEWSSHEEALKATEVAMKKPSCMSFFECIEEGSTQMEHHPILHSSGTI